MDSSLIVPILGSATVYYGLTTKNNLMTALGLFIFFLPYILLSVFVAGWSGASQQKIKRMVALSSSVILTLAFLITRGA